MSYGTSSTTLRLYRHLLKAAARYPSVKRQQILTGIKDEFRENMFLEDPNELKKKIKVAEEGLDQIRMYTDLDNKTTDWSLHLKGGL